MKTKIYISECRNMIYRSKEIPKFYDNVNKKNVTLKEPTKEQINAFFRGVAVNEKTGDGFNYYDYDNARYFSQFCNEHKVVEYSKRFYGANARIDITEQEYKENLKD